jgi:hypothetical protein
VSAAPDAPFADVDAIAVALLAITLNGVSR